MMPSAATIMIGCARLVDLKAAALPAKLACSVPGGWRLSKAALIASMASLSEVPVARLNEIVTAGNWP
jgi:hypothetical protein